MIPRDRPDRLLRREGYAVPAQHGFNVGNRLFQSGERVQVHSQMCDDNPVIGCNAINHQKAQRLAGDMHDAVVVPRVGELINEDERRAGAGNAGNSPLNARDNLCCGRLGRLGHDSIPPRAGDELTGQMIDAAQEALQERLAGELGQNWPFARLLAEAALKAGLAQMNLVPR